MRKKRRIPYKEQVLLILNRNKREYSTKELRHLISYEFLNRDKEISSSTFIYGAKMMEERGFIKIRKEKVKNTHRYLYSITERGKKELNNKEAFFIIFNQVFSNYLFCNDNERAKILQRLIIYLRGILQIDTDKILKKLSFLTN